MICLNGDWNEWACSRVQQQVEQENLCVINQALMFQQAEQLLIKWYNSLLC